MPPSPPRKQAPCGPRLTDGTSLPGTATWPRTGQSTSLNPMARNCSLQLQRVNCLADCSACSDYFNKYVGAQAESDSTSGAMPAKRQQHRHPRNDDGFQSVLWRYHLPLSDGRHHAVCSCAGRAEQVNGPDSRTPTRWGPDLTAGGGMDYETPWLNHRLAIRIFQADYQYMHANFGPVFHGGRANINAARLSAGLVFSRSVRSHRLRRPSRLPARQHRRPSFPGDPVTVTATASGLQPEGKCDLYVELATA